MSRPIMRCATIVMLAAICAFAAAAQAQVVITVERPKPAAEVRVPFQGERPAVDLAILLDTSNSMDGLIHQAKSQLWTIVQQFEGQEERPDSGVAGRTVRIRQ